jgi:hypothetical protein
VKFVSQTEEENASGRPGSRISQLIFSGASPLSTRESTMTKHRWNQWGGRAASG